MTADNDRYQESLVDEGFRLCHRCDGWGAGDMCVVCGGEGQVKDEDDADA